MGPFLFVLAIVLLAAVALACEFWAADDAERRRRRRESDRRLRDEIDRQP